MIFITEDLPEVELICHLFTLGEVALMCPARTPKHVFMLVQSIIAAPVANEAGKLTFVFYTLNSSAARPVYTCYLRSLPLKKLSMQPMYMCIFPNK